MFPCCNLTYEKYINEDGSLDKDEVWKIIMRLRSKGVGVAFIEKWQRNICKCSCHKKGIDILH